MIEIINCRFLLEARAAFEKSRGMDDSNRYHPSPILPNGEYRLTSHVYKWMGFLEGVGWALRTKTPLLYGQTGVGEWCALGPAAGQTRKWLLVFEDKDMDITTFDDELEARTAFAKAEDMGWNCHLFQHAQRAGQYGNTES